MIGMKTLHHYQDEWTLSDYQESVPLTSLFVPIILQMQSYEMTIVTHETI